MDHAAQKTLPSLRDYLLLELRHAPLRAPLAMALWGVLAVLGTHALLVRFPPRVIHFLEQAFRLQGMAAVLLLNDLLAAYFTTFFVGLAGLLAAVVSPREEKQLELLMAKPLRPRVLLTARVGPVLAGAGAAGLIVSAVTAAALRPHLTPADQVTAAGALGSGLSLVALALALLSILLPIFVRMRDSFHALMIACFVWLAPLIPTAAFIYRPDVFDGHPRLSATIVLSTLLWNDATSAWLGPAALALSLPLCTLMLTLAAHLLERTDVN